jgi:hypothetical protein
VKQAPPRLGQVAITVNGECCPRAESKSAQVNFTQRVFELEGGPMTGMPGMEQLPTTAAIYDRAIAWLEEMKRKAVAAGLDG